jgi:hypothetical protein
MVIINPQFWFDSTVVVVSESFIMLGSLQGVQCSSCGLFQLERQPFDPIVHTYIFRHAYACVFRLVTFHTFN